MYRYTILCMDIQFYAWIMFSVYRYTILSVDNAFYLLDIAFYLLGKE